MKKLSVIIAILALGAITLAGCGKKEEEMRYLSDFKAGDFIKLGEYKGLSVDVEARQIVSEDDLDDYVKYVADGYKENVEVTDRDTVQDGDIANIDYEGKIDGVAFDGGTSTGCDLTIGSGMFIPGFEDQVIGMKVGETRDINVTFPENYGQNNDLAGKEAVFTVKVNAILEEIAPEINDELAQKMNIEGVTNLAELKEYLKNDLQAGYDSEYDSRFEEALESALIANSEIVKIPSGFEDRLTEQLVSSIEETAATYGVDAGIVAQYYYGISDSDYKTGLRNYVRETLAPQYLVMAAVAEKEGIKISDEEVDEDIRKMLEDYDNMYSVEEYKEMMGDIESYKEYMMISRVVDIMKENAIINEK